MHFFGVASTGKTGTKSFFIQKTAKKIKKCLGYKQKVQQLFISQFKNLNYS